MSQDYTVGQKLGDYEILGILGAGGMGTVYAVERVTDGRQLALGLADGSVRGVSPGLSGATWWAAVTPADGEVLGSDW